MIVRTPSPPAHACWRCGIPKTTRHELPQDDTRTYQQAIRNGDYIVSVEVDEDTDLVRIQEVMRRPEEAHDLDELSERYSGARYEPRREPLGENYDERWASRYDQTRSSSHTRSYIRDAPLGSARRDIS